MKNSIRCVALGLALVVAVPVPLHGGVFNWSLTGLSGWLSAYVGWNKETGIVVSALAALGLVYGAKCLWKPKSNVPVVVAPVAASTASQPAGSQGQILNSGNAYDYSYFDNNYYNYRGEDGSVKWELLRQESPETVVLVEQPVSPVAKVQQAVKPSQRQMQASDFTMDWRKDVSREVRIQELSKQLELWSRIDRAHDFPSQAKIEITSVIYGNFGNLRPEKNELSSDVSAIATRLLQEMHTPIYSCITPGGHC